MLVGKTSLSLACRLSEDFHFRPLDCFGAPGAPVSFSCTGLDSARNPIQSNPNRALADIEVVIQYEAIRQDTSVVGGSSVLIVCDLLQRIGRAARGWNRKARAYICINDSYWIPRNTTSNT